jgi:glutamate synthase (NADPH/NADH) small chain
MSEESTANTAGKYAWGFVDRRDPAKRTVAERVSDFLEIYAGFDEATARAQASRCIQCPNPSCVTGCPLSNRIPEWLALTAEGAFLEAAEISQSTSNLPEICGRICPQERLCEGSCILNGKAEPVSIGAIERFINEYAFAHGRVVPSRPMPNGHKVAVIGSGPGGLACADQLAKLGYTITVFEAQPVPGGLLVNGIPAFKLEKNLVFRRIELLKQLGVEFRLGVRVGTDLSLEELLSNFDAVFLGVGAHKAKPLGCPGAELRGVYQSLPFLVAKNSGLRLDVPDIDVAGKRVAVVGGGDSAMDSLRTAVRCGAIQAVCIYRRDQANMPGSKKEFAVSVEEGAEFMFLTSPVEVLGNGNGEVRAVRCQKMELGPPDASGRRSPRPVAGSEFEVPADVVLIAFGFDPTTFPPGSDFGKIKTNKWDQVLVDENQMTSVPGVFAGGDLVRGPSLVSQAVRDARKAAEGIHRWVQAKQPAAR